MPNTLRIFILLFIVIDHIAFLHASPREFLEEARETKIQSDCILYEITPIEKEAIIGHDGKIYQKLIFESELEAFIMMNTRDSEKAQRIYKQYQKLLSVLNSHQALKEPFEKWIREHLPLLGCQKRCLEQLEKDPFLQSYSMLLKPFFYAIGCPEHDHQKPTRLPPRRILILTTSAGGGELMVAKSIEKLLKSHSFEVTCLDVKKVQKEADIFYQYSGMQHEDIYSEIFQKENNRSLAYKLTNLAEAIRPFINDNTYAVLKNKIQSLQPDLILTTRYSFPLDISFAYDLNIPLRFIHCDYRFSPELLPFVEKVDPSLVKFWIPAEYKECFPENISSPDKCIEVLGYPIRESFKKEFNPVCLTRIRERYEIMPDQKVVVMMMGLHGVGKIMLDLLQRIQTSDHILPSLHIAIICGHNSVMEKEMLAYIHKNPFPAHIQVHVYGLLDEQALSDYYSIADGFIGKAGGSTTSELIAMGLPAIQFTSFTNQPKAYEWEEANLRYLVYLGLGQHMKHPDEFLNLVTTLVNKKKDKTELPLLDWQTRLITLINQ